MRLQKYMAKAGVASRRESEEIIQSGAVRVNGKVVDTPGYKIDVQNDVVQVNNTIIKTEEKKYYILNKPRGYLCTAKDTHDRKTVFDIVKTKERLHTIGRLDKETEGLIILTNDGELTQRLTHPKYKIDKTYRAVVNGTINKDAIKNLEKGVVIEGYRTAPAKVRCVESGKTQSVIEIIIHEGKKRQVRLMCKAVGYPVIQLQRIAVGNISTGNLAVGKYRLLTVEEIKYLKGEKNVNNKLS
jgi:23S rRNA pseudouridine2605 synthase